MLAACVFIVAKRSLIVGSSRRSLLAAQLRASSFSRRAAACIVAKLGLTARLLLTPRCGVHRRQAGFDCSAPSHAALRRASSPSWV